MNVLARLEYCLPTWLVTDCDPDLNDAMSPWGKEADETGIAQTQVENWMKQRQNMMLYPHQSAPQDCIVDYAIAE